MKNLLFIVLLLTAPSMSYAGDLTACFDNSENSVEFNYCVNENTNEEFDLNTFLSSDPEPDPGYDCSVYRNYRDRNGNYVCPTTDYDACLKEYGPRLPPPYFGFVKHWCWCNCVYDPDDI